MIKYKRVYCEAFNMGPGEYFPSELSGSPAVDIHHINGRMDRIENLIALTREEHTLYGDKKKYMYYLLLKHKEFLDEHKVKYCKAWFKERLEFYKHLAILK